MVKTRVIKIRELSLISTSHQKMLINKMITLKRKTFSSRTNRKLLEFYMAYTHIYTCAIIFLSTNMHKAKLKVCVFQKAMERRLSFHTMEGYFYKATWLNMACWGTAHYQESLDMGRTSYGSSDWDTERLRLDLQERMKKKRTKEDWQQ